MYDVRLDVHKEIFVHSPWKIVSACRPRVGSPASRGARTQLPRNVLICPQSELAVGGRAKDRTARRQPGGRASESVRTRQNHLGSFAGD